MKNILLVLFVFLFLGLTCNKNKQDPTLSNCNGNCTIIEGKITDATSGNPIKNASIAITYKYPSFTFGSSKSIGTVQTDETGSYQIKFDYNSDNLNNSNSASHYELIATQSNYIFDSSFLQHTATSIKYIYLSDSLKRDIPYKLDFMLFPKATLSLSTVCLSNTMIDNYTIGYSYTNYIIPKFNGNSALTDGTYQLPVVGNKYTIFYVTKTENGITSSFTDSVFCKSGQMNYYTLKW